jgi:hypothetical protein
MTKNHYCGLIHNISKLRTEIYSCWIVSQWAHVLTCMCNLFFGKEFSVRVGMMLEDYCSCFVSRLVNHVTLRSCAGCSFEATYLAILRICLD